MKLHKPKGRLISTLIVFFLLLFSCQVPEEKSNKPNIIVIIADDLGWNDVGFHGSDIQTPTLDSLVAVGLELNRFYTAPICSPTRAGLMTGQYPDRYGVRDGVFSPRVIGGLPPEAITLAEMLAEAGYGDRGMFGKWHLGHSDKVYHPLSQGFTYFYGHLNGAIDYFTHTRNGALDWHENWSPSFDAGYSSDLIASSVVNFIDRRDQSTPFFTYVAFNAPHSPMQSKLEDLRAYGYQDTIQNKPYPSGGAQHDEYNIPNYGQTGRGNTLRQTYSAMVKSVDDGVKTIVDHLHRQGIADHTLIWFLSDNGGVSRFGGNNEPLRGQKHTEWEGGVRTPSFIVWEGEVESGVSNEVVSYIDIFPTLSNLVGNQGFENRDGIDVSGVFQGKALNSRSLFLGHKALVTRQWKINQGELFAIEQDPTESYNLAGEHIDVLDSLEKELIKIKMQVESGITLRKRDTSWRPHVNWSLH